jgi:hypothetical protein
VFDRRGSGLGDRSFPDYDRLIQPNSERCPGPYFGLDTFGEQDTGDTRAGSDNPAKHGAFTTACDPSNDCADRAASSDEHDGPVTGVAGDGALVIDSLLVSRVGGGQGASQLDPGAVWKNEVVEIDCDCPGLAFTLGRLDGRNVTFDRSSCRNDRLTVDVHRYRDCSRESVSRAGMSRV